MDKPAPEEQRRGNLSRRRFFNSVAVGATEAAILTIPDKAEAQSPALEAGAGQLVKVALNVNGQTHSLMVEPRWSLLHVLRDRLGLTGTKPGCERGECGACTVLIDGVARYSCLTLAVEAAGAQVTTLEGLMRGEQLGPVQQAFLEEDAFQCGYCTPGQVMNVEGLLRKTSDPTMEQIREGVSGNLCRCGAYANIFRAVKRAAELKKAES
ncbi:MAG: (2Fe-2S)-binding protein [Bryobacteraceae bacterium]|jgi:xanthine dehydrogenase YagT iron-sulfur-binding subunit